ncbi:MAG: LptF/LptG family permease [Betaproteobacteria bacterium]
MVDRCDRPVVSSGQPLTTKWRRFLLFDRYLLREFVGPFALALLAVTVLMLSDFLFTLADWLIVKRVAAGVILRLIGYRLPGLVVQAVPVAVLAGALLTLYRLARDSELVIMSVSGLSFERVVAPLLTFTLALSGASYAVNEAVVPQANHAAENIVRRLVFQEVLPEVREGVFFRGQDDTVYYLRRFDRTNLRMEDVMVFRPGSAPYPEMITARVARYGKGVWHLEDGIRREMDREGFVTRETRFGSLDLQVDDGVEQFFGNQKTTQEMSRAELRANIRLFGQGGVDVRSLLVDYHLKLVQPLASFFFSLLGIPLALWVLRRPRSSPVLGTGGAMALVLTYYVVAPLCRSLGVNGLLQPLAAAWLPSLAFGLVGLFLFARLEQV